MGTQENRTTGRQARSAQVLSEIQRRIVVGNERIARQQYLIAIFARFGFASLGSHQLLKNLQQLQLLHERHRDLLQLGSGDAVPQKDAAVQ